LILKLFPTLSAHAKNQPQLTAKNRPIVTPQERATHEFYLIKTALLASEGYPVSSFAQALRKSELLIMRLPVKEKTDV